MKIGIFDSGAGGLILAQAIANQLPQYDYLYLGDTLNLPYGLKNHAEIYQLTIKALDYLFKENCLLVIVACNTISAEVLRVIQQEYLPRHYPDRKVLGVIVPTAEEVAELKPQSIGVLATRHTVASSAYLREIHKLLPNTSVVQVAAVNLARAIEENNQDRTDKLIRSYLTALTKTAVDTIVLGCTHYSLVKDVIRSYLGSKINVVSQDEIIPEKLASYLAKHSEITCQLSQNSLRTYQVTRVTRAFQQLMVNTLGIRSELLTVHLAS